MLPPSPAVELHCFFERFVAHRVAAFVGRTANDAVSNKITASYRRGSASRRDVDMFIGLVVGLSEIVDHLRREGGPQRVQYGQNVDDFLCDGTAHRT
jgi:hypothetical protein